MQNDIQSKGVQTPNKRTINKKRAVLFLVVAAIGIMMFALPVFATDSSTTQTVTASGMMGQLISLMCGMFKYVGMAIFVWAIIQFILATKRSDADSKADAIQTGMCGIALMMVGTIVGKFNLGVTISSDVLS